MADVAAAPPPPAMPGQGGLAPSSPAALSGDSVEAQRLATVTSFLQDLCSGLSRDTGRKLSLEQVSELASMHLAPDCTVHVDGLLGAIPPTQGPEAFTAFIQQERAAYRTVSLEPLLAAVSPDCDVAFALSAFRMKNTGPWHGQPPSGRTSAGFRLDELRFNAAGQVAEAWCNRQLFEEERPLMIRDPSRHHPAAFDPTLLQNVPAPQGGSSDESAQLMSPQQLTNMAGLWAEAWNVSADVGEPDPSQLDALVDPDFQMLDALGLTGDDGQDHPYTAIHSLEDAKRVLLTMAKKYDINETVQTMAVKPGSNAVFVHWQASERGGARRALLNPLPAAAAAEAAESAGAGGSAAAGGADIAASAASTAAAGPYKAEACDLLIFNPSSGKLRAVLQFRKPLGSDRRGVLMADTSPAGPPEATMAE
ncbi:hypothetical protein HYH03_017518 [Edaphochlamys debaryana]|uniref:Uncharacterized protein n=1 Tax=Edaphochlamys debaryana TaxID=47281 RepID=A0A836BNU6_9CHLO|nr:hypothetical protein HYH03_017518 [Edaphochlamys debaryana]|eukprot:KAG2483641.1 hypothetical protein HYH03_017518 [Edaphochlamys debaryana]